MAGKLDRLLQPDERVAFRTRQGWRRTGLTVALGLALSTGLWGAFSWLGGSEQQALQTMLLTALLTVALTRYGGETLVTDMRVLHRAGFLRPRTLEIPLWHIARLERVSGYLTLRGRTGETWHLDSVPKLEDLAAAIVTEAGVPAPKPPSPRIRAWRRAGGFFCIACGLGALFLLIVAGAVAIAMGWLAAVPYYLVHLSALPAFPAAILLGIGAGQILVTLAMGRFLSAAEAREFFAAAGQDERPKWLSIPGRLPFAAARRVATFLYEEPI